MHGMYRWEGMRTSGRMQGKFWHHLFIPNFPGELARWLAESRRMWHEFQGWYARSSSSSYNTETSTELPLQTWKMSLHGSTSPFPSLNLKRFNGLSPRFNYCNCKKNLKANGAGMHVKKQIWMDTDVQDRVPFYLYYSMSKGARNQPYYSMY